MNEQMTNNEWSFSGSTVALQRTKDGASHTGKWTKNEQKMNKWRTMNEQKTNKRRTMNEQWRNN